jgi:hypothetical protein
VVRVSKRWQGETNAPALCPDGRVIFFHGAGLPTIVCAPPQVCMIELQASERVVGEPHIGDSVRWYISPAMYGTGGQSTAVIILKPQTPGLDTNLLITTGRRAYYLRLISKFEASVERKVPVPPSQDKPSPHTRTLPHRLRSAMSCERTQNATSRPIHGSGVLADYDRINRTLKVVLNTRPLAKAENASASGVSLLTGQPRRMIVDD